MFYSPGDDKVLMAIMVLAAFGVVAGIYHLIRGIIWLCQHVSFV